MNKTKKMTKLSERSQPKSDFLENSFPNLLPQAQSLRLQFLLNNFQFNNNSKVS